jgi:hypothetical protein
MMNFVLMYVISYYTTEMVHWAWHMACMGDAKNV